MAISASTAAAFSAARLSEAGSAAAGCAPTWATSRPTRRRRHSRWRVSSGKLWSTGKRPTPTSRAASQQASPSTASCGRDAHQTWEFEERLATDAAADEASVREEAKLNDLEESERMPAA
eukprot:6178110-Pleurochrysis_carterae.AAC.2